MAFPAPTDIDNISEFNSDSILNSVKKLLGLDSSFHAFDPDLIFHINSVLFIMYQMGIGQQFMIYGEDETWSSYLEGRTDLEAVKTYVGAKVRQIFDPPTTGAVKEALENTIKELEWRLFSETDLKVTKPEDLVAYEDKH